MSQNNKITLTIVLLIAFAALLTGFYVANHYHTKPSVELERFHGTWLKNPHVLNHFELTGTNGEVFNNDSLKGHWTMMFFGFTNCGYLCPTSMAELGKTYRLLQEKGVKNLPVVVMVTVDPNRDSLEKLNDYVKAFDKHFIGARGSNEKVKVLAQEMGIAFEQVNVKDASQSYDIQHSGAVILFNPKGELNAFFTTPHHATFLAEDFMQVAS